MMMKDYLEIIPKTRRLCVRNGARQEKFKIHKKKVMVETNLLPLLGLNSMFWISVYVLGFFIFWLIAWFAFDVLL